MEQPRRILGRIGAVLAGFAAIVVITTLTDIVLHAAGMFPPWGERNSDGMLLVATAYRVVFTVAGAYITARLAPDRPLAHAVALGFVGIVAGTIGAVATWNAGPAFEPKW